MKKKPQGSETDDLILQYFNRNMEPRKEIPTTLLGIIELLRINAPKCILNKEEKHKFFSLLIEILPKEKINLERFIAYRIPSILTNKVLILKLVNLIGVISGTAKQYLKEIIIILIEESEEEMMKKILEIVLLNVPKDPTLNSIIEATRKISMSIVELIMEEFDDKKYADVYSNLTLNKDLCIRNIKGMNRMRYIEAALSEKNFEKLCNFYIGDRDKRVVRMLANNYTLAHRAIFHRLLTDTDEEVRVLLMEKLSFEEMVRFDLEIYERVLDMSPRVRSVAFRIFKSGAEMYIRCFIGTEKENGNNGNAEEEFLNDVLRCFLRLIQFMLKGVLTKQKNEYIKVLEECNFPWEFYFQIRSYKGLYEYLKSISVEIGLLELPQCVEKRRFYLKYFFKGEIPKENVIGLIEEDVYYGLMYLRNKDIKEYLEYLITRGLSGSVAEILMIIDLIHPYLSDKAPMLSPVSDGELLIYAHSKHSFVYVEDVCNLPLSFPVLYFLAHMKIPIDVILPKLLKYKGSCEEYIEI